MSIQALEEAARELFGICVTVAALDPKGLSSRRQTAGEGGPARAFRALCALAAALCALRMVARLF
jgi:hypothetical protein